ncbi:hypothetical protein OCU04_006867 [Sclerotinia nivalis]|uniref:Uncharacterized protein n=1 Tax=Sclerotinia nivalis TaxID=352851 RepID=A0A9X0AKN3_9HELO|nr:hypothetical protein OCU04_006867 [Sclerotinia nivalis]
MSVSILDELASEPPDYDLKVVCSGSLAVRIASSHNSMFSNIHAETECLGIAHNSA